MTSPRSWRLAANFSVLLVAMACVGTLTLLGALREGGLAHLHDGIPWEILVVPFAVFDVIVLNVQTRREARSVSLSEIPMAVGLAFATPTELVVARVGGALIVYLVVRRQYQHPNKLLFNTLLAFTETSIALAVYRAIAASSHASSPLSWVATVVANVLASCLAAVCVSLVIQAFEGSWSWRDLMAPLPGSSVQAAMVSVFGVIAVVSLATNRDSLALLLIGAASVVVAYRAYAKLNDRHLSLERVYRFSQVISSSREMTEVLVGILSQAREMLHAEQAFIAFQGGEQGVELSLGRSASLQRTPVTVLTAEPRSPIGSAFAGDGAALVSRNSHDAALREWLGARGIREIVAAPLRGDSGVVAVLAVVDRLGEARAFDREDARLLETVAIHASIALHNGQLVDQLRYDSLHDALTGLPNRVYFQRALDDYLEHLPTDRVLAVGILDLDDFKDVNDTLGHDAGDELLREVARRLTDAGGRDVLVARLGGDEFAVAYLTSPARAKEVAAALVAALHHTVMLRDIELEIGGSLGIATTETSGVSRDVLIKNADLAMYSAKHNSLDVWLYESTPARTNTDQLTLVGKLRSAIAASGLEIYVQPKVSLATGEVTSAEALLRWTDHDRGPISPEEFVPLAERSGLIRPLTNYVLQTAISACAGWQARMPGVGVAVNISMKNLTDDAIVGLVTFLLRRYEVPAALLTLEVTESSIMSDPARMLAVLEELNSHGVRISIDDFGKGYSSLSYLQRLPVREIKIDRSFVTNLTHDRDNAAISRSIIELASALELDIVAEGIETIEDWETLRRLRCTVGQGYLISEPMPISALGDWHAAWWDRNLASGAGTVTPLSPGLR